MAKYFKLFTIFSLFFLVSCQEGGEAGDLWGQWRMTESDDKYLSFSGSVLLFRNISKGEVFGNFQHVGDSLFMQCYSANGLPSDTTIVETAFGFKPFNNIRVKIEVLDGDVLVLSKDNQTWDFYKY